MGRSRWLSDPEQHAWRGLQDMHARLTAALARQLAESSSLSYPDYAVLIALSSAPDGRMRAFELSDATGWEQSRLSHQVSRMAARDLVKKERCHDDGRGAYVVITPQGRKELAAAAPAHVEAVRRMFIDQVTPSQLQVIAQVADQVLAGLDAEAQTEAQTEPQPHAGSS